VRVGIVGGSIGGLTAALLLRDAGCDVEVYERTPTPLKGFGAGIVLHPATTRYLAERGSVKPGAISIPSTYVRYLDVDGSTAHEEDCLYRYTAWSTIYQRLLAMFPPERYHQGEALVGFDLDGERVGLRLAGGRREVHDIVVCADGISSTARRRLLPEVAPGYSGYVGWRGIVRARSLSQPTLKALERTLVYQALGNSHILAYLIPAFDGAAKGPFVNFVWYRNVAPGVELDELMTGRDGFPRTISVHPGDVQERFVVDLRRDARRLLAAPLAEIVEATAEPFIQAIVDVESPRMAFERVCLIGDAAFVARPHTAAGTAKAAEDAWLLARAVGAADGDVVPALRAWEETQLELGRRLVARARELGERSQFEGSWDPADPSLRFGLYAPGGSVAAADPVASR
jgi:2,6-dihydroxypyridine 3-monooxygenase